MPRDDSKALAGLLGAREALALGRIEEAFRLSFRALGAAEGVPGISHSLLREIRVTCGRTLVARMQVLAGREVSSLVFGNALRVTRLRGNTDPQPRNAP